jgi:tetratricopeptide (TPR) repeat protein
LCHSSEVTPLATRIAARFWAEHPSADISKDISIFEKLRDTIVAFILEKISLSSAEKELLLFASIFRLPAPRGLFLRWRGNEANYLLDSLAGEYLIESTETGYQLHPLVRDFFYHKLSPQSAIAHHKMAARFFDELLKKNRIVGKPVIPECLGEAVYHYLQAGDWRAVNSLRYYKEELKPVALSHFQKKQYDLAMKDYSALIELDRDDVDANFHLSLLHARNSNWDDAELYFEKARSLRPKAAWILQGFANAKLRADKLAEAEQLLSEAEHISPNHSPTLVDLGRLREKQGNPAAAEDYYRKAVDANPDNPFANYMLAGLLFRQGEFGEAYEFAEAAVATNPTDERNKALVQELKKKMGD